MPDVPIPRGPQEREYQYAGRIQPIHAKYPVNGGCNWKMKIKGLRLESLYSLEKTPGSAGATTAV